MENCICVAMKNADNFHFYQKRTEKNINILLCYIWFNGINQIMKKKTEINVCQINLREGKRKRQSGFF